MFSLIPPNKTDSPGAADLEVEETQQPELCFFFDHESEGPEPFEFEGGFGRQGFPTKSEPIRPETQKCFRISPGDLARVKT